MAADPVNQVDTPSRPERSPRRRRWLRLGLLAAVLAAPAAFYFYYIASADSALRQAIDEANRLDPGWRLEELEAKRPTIPDEENAAVQSLSASAKMPWPWQKNLPFHERLEKVPPPRFLSDVDTAVLRAEVATMSGAVSEARKVAGLAHGRYPVRWRAEGITTPMPHIDDNNKLVMWLQADVLLRVQDNDGEGAWVSAVGLLNTARALTDEPCALSQSIHASWRNKGVAALERILARGQVKDRTLEQTQRVLEEDADRPLLLPAMRGERALCDRLMTALEKGDTDLRKILPMMSMTSSTPANLWLPQRLPRVATLGMVKESHAWLLRHLNALVEASKLPPGERERKLAALKEDLAAAPPLAAVFMPSTRQSAFQRSQGRLRCASAALAAERYRLQNGRWPEKLESLVQAGLLQAVPADPFGGAPLRFRQPVDGIVIYSVGEDGRYGGAALDDLNNYAEDLQRVEFRLWNPDQRGRLPFVAAP